MGNCLTSKFSKQRDIVICTLGLDNSGKTTVIKALQGENIDDVTPTVGFNSATLKNQKHKYNVTIFDVGGGARIREIWATYYPDVFAIIFVIDASDLNRLDEAKETFMSVLKHPHIQGKPILLLLNKQDSDGALDEVDAEQHMDLARAVSHYQSHCRIETTIATKGAGKKNMDPSVRAGYVWLLDQISRLHQELEERVTEDVAAAKIRQAKERKEVLERIRARREEEEAEEREETQVPEVVDSAVVDRELPPVKPFRNRVLPFQPLPEIREEATSLRSLDEAHSVGSNRSLLHNHHADTQTESVRHSQPQRVGLGGSVVPQLPAISPQPIRRLPPITGQINHNAQNGALGTHKRNSVGYESENVNNAKQSSDDISQRSDVTHKRKRKRKRLRRFSNSPAISPSESEDSARQTDKPRPIEFLATLPSSEPAAQTNGRQHWTLAEEIESAC